MVVKGKGEIMKYLKKKKMYALVQQIVELDREVKLIHCEYRFYRGMEWLLLHDDSFIYELCASNEGAYLALTVHKLDDDLYERKLVRREVLNGFGRVSITI